jgi:hypothetical protein
MTRKHVSRRDFMTSASAGTIAAITSGTASAYAQRGKKTGKLAIRGGRAVRTKPFQSWPIWDRSAEKDILAILRSGNWFRGSGETVTQFEKAYADLLGAKRCVCTVNGASRQAFLAALRAEGIPCSGGYGPQYRDGLIEVALQSKNFTRSFSKARLDQYRRELDYPDNDKLCEEAVWLSQTLLLGNKRDIDDIADAIAKIAKNKDQLV